MKEKVSAGFFKVMAVAGALAIGGGYVAWRQNDAEKAKQRQRIEQAKAKEAKIGEEMELMVGSKNPSGRLITIEEIDDLIQNDFIEPIPGIPEGTEEMTDIAPLLPGSKSISMPLFTKRQIKELQSKDKAEEEVEIAPEDLLPSSKIGILRLPKKEVDPSGKKDPEKSE